MAVIGVNHTECVSKYNCLRLLIFLLLAITGNNVSAQKTISVNWPFSFTGTIDNERVLNDCLSQYTYTSTILRYAPANFTATASYSSEITPKTSSQTADGLGNVLDPPFTEFTVNEDTNDKTISFAIKPNISDNGYKLVPTGFSLDAYRNGTDNCAIELYLTKGGSDSLLVAALYGYGFSKKSSYSSNLPQGYLYRLSPSKNSETGLYTTEDYVADSLTYNSFSVTSLSSGYEVNQNETLYFVIKVKGFSGNRTLGLRNVTVTCELDYSDTYAPQFDGKEIANASVLHKKAKWYDIRSNMGYDESDTFGKDDDTENGMEGMVALDNSTLVQAAHVYVDTIYMAKGTSMNILLPSTKGINNSSISNYFRWYNYRNDKNFYCGGSNTVGSANGEDLLTPYSSDYVAWRFNNGYVTGTLNYDTNNTNSSDSYSTTYTLREITFYYPTDNEFNSISSSLGQSDNTYYAVACDASIYSDFEEQSQYGGAEFGSTSSNGSTTYWEPTLAGRMLYYIVGVDSNTGTSNSTIPSQFKQYEQLFTNPDYQGGTNVAGKKYLEEYEITFPSRRISNNTKELVALSKDAQSYAVPGETTQSSDALSVAFASGENNGLALYTTSLTGDARIIQFYKSGISSTSNQWTVDNNSTATILVTKSYEGKTYNIARYKLVFKDECIPLTEIQVAGLKNITDTATCTYWWKNLTYRSPEYIKKNYEKLDALNFDYGSEYNANKIFGDYGQEQHYPYPMRWDNSSYAFYDGCIGTDVYPTVSVSGTLNDSYSSHASFSMYALVNSYIGYSDIRSNRNDPHVPLCSTNTEMQEKNHDGYWIYVDASDRPGTLAELTLDEALCPGAEIIVSAWIKSASQGTSTSDADAAVLFTVMGVDAEGNHTPIYRECSGQIRTTMGLTGQLDEDGLDPLTVTGKGTGTNEWFQVYFTFKNVGSKYSSYTIKIDNYCSSTSGGDFYLDQIEAYVAQPTVEVTSVTPLCSDTKETQIRVDLDYETIMARYGEDAEDYGYGDLESDSVIYETQNSVDFIIFDRYVYDKYVSEHPTEENVINNALKASILELSLDDDDASELYPTKFPTLSFYYYYGKNKEYGDETTYPYDGYFLWSENTVTGVISLSANFFTTLSPYTPYEVILITEVEDYSSLSEDEKISLYADELEGGSATCTIMSDFYATATTTMHINGSLADPTLTYCEGQTVHVIPTLTYTDEDGETQTLEGEYFDWFYGTVDEYLSTPSEDEDIYGGVTLQAALIAFRDAYPTATALDSSYETYKEDSLNLDAMGALIFTEYDYNVMNYWLTKEYGEEGSGIDYLVLYQQYMDITVVLPGVSVVVQPIKVNVSTETEEETVSQLKAQELSEDSLESVNEGNTTEDNDVVFRADWEPDSGQIGNEDLDFGGNSRGNSGGNTRDGTEDDDTEDDTDICFGYVTLVLEASGDAPLLKLGFYNVNYPDDYSPWLRIGLNQLNSTSADNTLKVNLHGAKYSSDDVNHIGTVKDDDSEVDYTQLFLIDTNDTAYSKYFTDDFNEYDLPVGYIAELKGAETATGSEDTSYMRIYFNTNPTDENNIYFSPKEGYTYTFTVHFQEKADEEETATTNSCYGTFPLEMKIVPEYLVWQGTRADNWNDDSMWRRASKAELNKASDSTDYTDNDEYGTDNGFVPMLFTKVVMPKDSEAELYMAGFKKDSNGMYDWSGEDSKPSAITASPTDNIIYDMMTYEDEETGLAVERYRVNLCNQLYLPTGAELLHSELLLCDTVRLDVAIPHSTWNLLSLPLQGVVSGDWYTKTGGTETEEYFKDISFSSADNSRYNPLVYQRSWNSTSAVIVSNTNSTESVPSYSSTGWTSVYNDASVAYQAGVGISVKAFQNNDNNSGDDFVFRFPKSDTSYDYSTSRTLSRIGAGQLKVAELVDRSNADKDGDDVYGDDITVTLTPTSDGYCLVGNPFTSCISMAEFLKGNSEFITGYWLGTSTTGPIAGGSTGTSWGTDDAYLLPYGAFYVKADMDSLAKVGKSEVEISFSKDMQVLASDTTEEQIKVFAIRAANSAGVSSAALAYLENATDGYSAAEDAVLLEDESWHKSGMPLVYTVAGDRAVSVNSLRSQSVIPLGVFADEGSAYTLTFVGVDNVDEPTLYDTELNTETPITEGLSLAMQGATYGRYFIHANAPSSTEITVTENNTYGVTVYSPASRTIVVSSDTEIQLVEVYSIGGNLLKRATVDGISCTLNDINSDIVIVKVYTKEGENVSKLKVNNLHI